MKKPKKEWQVAVKSKCDFMGISYKELAERVGVNAGTLKQAMAKDNVPGVRAKVCEYLGIKIQSEA